MARGPAPPPPDPAAVRHLARSLRRDAGGRDCPHRIAYHKGPCAACDTIEDRIAALAAERRRRQAELKRAIGGFASASVAAARQVEAALIPAIARGLVAAAAAIRPHRRQLDEVFRRLAGEHQKNSAP